MFLFVFLLLFNLHLINSIPHTFYTSKFDEYVCQPCTRPLDGALLLLPHKLKCLDVGDVLFRWPGTKREERRGDEVIELSKSLTNSRCPSGIKIQSDSIYLEDNLAKMKKNACFYRERTVKYKWRCTKSKEWRESELRVAVKPPPYKRTRRWLPRRRLPKHSPIHFQQDKYVVELAEDVQAGTLVVKIHANHASNQPLYYSMSAPDDFRSANLFALDTVSGEIRVAKPLDREQLAHHVLKLSAYERLDPQVSATATVIVDLLDVQDNSPQFERNAYFAEIKEDASPGTTVLNVFARDLDFGPNGEIVYSLQSQDDISQLFTIDPSSGVVQTKGKLDREVQNFVRMQAVATDKGSPPRNSTALIEITILDENDNVPQFTQPIYNVTIAENVTTPLIILKVEAKDADAGPNGEVHYSIVTSTSSLANLFSMDYDSGELTLRQSLDLKHSPYLLVIRAKDSGQPALSATAHCYVHVLDINDHAPTFLHASPLHTISVEENVRVGFELGRLYAVDEDGGRNGEVRYRLEVESDNVTRLFEIDELTGVLRTTQELDREQTDVYNMKVIASDLGSPPLSTELQLVIKVLDINDNSPKFERDYYELQLSEDTPRGKQLFELRATDADLDQKISYRIEHMDRPLFALIELSADDGAILSLAKPFSPLDEIINLRVSATDQGGLQGFVNLTLKIVDENSAPVFVETPISIRVNENVHVGSTVLHVKAKDNDRGANSKLVYSIDAEDFGINNSTGVIYVARELDRERRASYSVTVTVTDDGDPPLSSSTILEILVADVNDNYPHFLIDTYRTSISEDAAVGTSFLQIQATDPDEGPNGMIDYFLNDSDHFVRLDYFRLDRTSGLLQVNKPLDRETISSFDLQVIARDRGQPPLFSTAQIHITIDDVNDNPPHFQQQSYDLWVAENSAPGSVVGTLIATDADQGSNQHIQFKIFGGPDAKLFEIEADEEQNGVVRVKTRQEFDYEGKVNKFHVELQASSGQLSSTVPITIHISDQNDNQPQLADFVVLVARFKEEDDADQMVGSIPAFDPDKNATLEYYLEPNELLGVEPSTGTLRLKNAWHRQLNVQSRACVSDGPNTRCSTAQLIYVFVDDDALRQSVTLQLDSITRDTFMNPNFLHRFSVAVAELDDEWLPEDVRIFGIDEKLVDGRAQLNVSFFVVKEEQVVSPWRIEQTDRLQIPGLDQPALMVRDELCSNEPCAYYQQCKRSLKFDKAGHVQKQETDTVVFRTMPTLRSFACECPQGFGTNPSLPGLCNQRLSLCFAHSCINNSTCIPQENNYRCECVNDRTGPLCELSKKVDTCLPNFCRSNSECHLSDRQQQCINCPWRQQDTDEQCHLRSVSFGGDSQNFLLVPALLSRMEWELEMEFATVSQNAILLHSSAHLHFPLQSDFFELSVRSGLPQLKASLGAVDQQIEMQLGDWKENRVADGGWHKLKVEYRDWTFRLSLDSCDPQLSIHHRQTLGYHQCSIEVSFQLPAQCRNDLSLASCHRFLDLRPQIYVGGAPHSSNGLHGCVRSLKINSQLVDFSDFEKLEKLGDVQAGCRRFRPDSCLIENRCAEGAKCVDQWEGHLCQCANKLHSHKPCSLELPNGLSLQDEESYAQWRIPSKLRHQQLYFEFRTRERQTQVMAMEFKQKRNVFLFQLDGGKAAVRWGGDQFFFAFGDLADGRWHSVGVDFEKGAVTIDHLYKKQLWQPISTDHEQRPQTLYSGNVPSSAYPHQFLGCLRNVHFGGTSAKINDQSKTKPDCPVPNPCSSNTCPSNSQCIRDWDRHTCKCFQGYLGDQCRDACSIQGLCRNNGTCTRIVNGQRDYECICSPQFWGPNCEHQKVEEKCPPGWYGQFGACEKCECRMDRGFEAECGGQTGKCRCRPGMHLQHDRCVPCECGHGSANPNCNSQTGQCDCLGEAEGRRCDLCPRSIIGKTQLLERSTLKCVDLKDRCPLSTMDGITWPTTMRGAISRQSCPYGQLGVATRECSRTGQWLRVRSYNCTHPVLLELAKKWTVQMKDIPQIARQLLNITRSDFYLIRGRNLDLSIDTLVQLLSSPSTSEKEHLKDSDYTRHILAVFDQLFDQPMDEMQLYVLLSKVYEYGGVLSRLHAQVPYLRQFYFEGSVIDFSVQQHKFLTRRKRHLLTQTQPIKFAVSAPNATIFQAFVKRNCHLTSCRNYGSEIYMLQARVNGSHLQNHFGPIQIVFALRGDSSDAQWSYPECLRASISKEDPSVVRKTDYFDGTPDSTLEWTRKGGTLIGLNRTHAICQYSLEYEEPGSLFTLQIQPDSGALVQFALANHLPYTAPLSAAFALFLCLLALLATVFRSRVHMRSVRFAFIMSFVLSGTALFLLQRVAFNSMFCSVRNALLTYLLSAQFIWLLILALNTYRFLCNEKPQKRISLCFSAGLIMPCLLCTLSFVFGASCSLQFGARNLWFVAGPSAFFLLIAFYVMATSLLLACSGKYKEEVKRSAAKLMLWLAILTLLCTFHSLIALYNLSQFSQYPMLTESVYNILLVFTSIYIFLWANFLSKEQSPNRKNEFWLNDDASKQKLTSTEPDYQKPLLTHSQIQPSTTEWQPDLMMDTYIHHTLQRSLQPSQLASLPRPAGHYDEGGVYEQRYGSALNSTPPSLRGSVGRSPRLIHQLPQMRIAQNPLSEFGELSDDAYYEYRGGRQKASYSTFT